MTHKMTRKQVASKKEPAKPKRAIAKRRVSQLSNYVGLFEDIKTCIRKARIKAALATNRDLIGLYWEIGKIITQRQQVEGWGKAVVEHLAADIRVEFLNLGGFSAGNIWRMRAFYLAYTKNAGFLAQAARESSDENLAQAAREIDGKNLPKATSGIPWFNIVFIIQTLKDPIQRLWYARQTIEQGWSRDVLVHQIESDLYRHQGKALTNFSRNLPAPQSDLAQQLLKDSYQLDFLALGPDISERHLHRGLLEHLKDFIIELGKGFAFVGSEYHLEVGGQDYYLDLLFYHLKLHCYVVIELKTEDFKPEFAGKLNFYLSSVDEQLRTPDIDSPSIGLILCKDHNRVIVEYALRNSSCPMGVAKYEIRTTRRLPKALKDSLPTLGEFRAEWKKAEKEAKNQ